LDKATSNEERQEVIKRIFGKENPTYDEIKRFMKQIHQNTLDELDKTIKSRWVWGDKKQFLIVTRGLLSIGGRNFESIVDVWEDIDRLNRTTVLLGDAIKKNEKTTNELDDALSKLKTTLAEPRIAKVAELMELIEKKVQESGKAVRDYSV